MGKVIWAIRFSLKDLIYQRKISLFLVINLFIGTFGFLTIQIFQSSLQQDLSLRAQTMLAADFSISAQRQLTNEDIKLFEKHISFEQKTSVIQFFAMLKSKDKSRLISVRAFGKNYPFYGEIGSSQINLDDQSESVWLDPDAYKMLDIGNSADIQLGQLSIKKVEVIAKDSSRFLREAGLAPVLYISQSQLQKTQLLSDGSTLKTELLYKLKDPSRTKIIQQNFYKNINDPTIKFETATERSENNGTIFKYFTDYLGLVAIISISLSFLSGGYLMRWSFQHQKKNIGIYKTLGMTDSKIQFIYLFQVFLISLIAFLFSLTLFLFLRPFINFYLNSVSLPFQLNLTTHSLLICLLISLIAPAFMFMPINSEISKLNPKDLFLNQTSPATTFRTAYFWYFVCALGFWILSFYQAHSYKTASLFTLSIVVIILVLQYLLALILKLLNKSLPLLRLNWSTTYAIKSVINKKRSVSLVFITFTIAVLILTLLPHIKQSIVNELRPDQTSMLPRLFLFDVQSSQKDELQKMTQDLLLADLQFNPLVRARILKVNAISYDRLQNNADLSTREQEEEVRFRNRGVNLSYQSELKSSERIVEGKWNTANYDGSGTPEISLEKKYAERINAHLGDIMLFDVQGLEITGKVTSIRTVKWTSFNPNFFILFQNGALNEAPQTFLTSISTDKNYAQFQNLVVEKFPNISIIDINQTVQGILVFVDQMSLALQIMAVISIVLGFFVFFVLITTQIQERLAEFNLLKVMGTKTEVIRKIIFIQFTFIIGLSLTIGIGLGLLVTQFLIQYIFSINSSFDFKSIAIVTIAIVPIVFIFVALATRFLDRLSPIDLIRS